jgi:anti-anti-sigma factor
VPTHLTDGPQQAAATAPLVEIVVTEELTAPAAARLHRLMGDALALRPTHLVVDLAACPRADALAVDVLLNAHRRAFHLGIQLVLRAPSEGLRRVLGLAHLENVFNISSSSSAPPDRRPAGSPGPAEEGR